MKTKTSFLAIAALSVVGLTACEKQPVECLSVDGPYIIDDMSYDKLAKPLPRCVEKKPVEQREGETAESPAEAPAEAPAPDPAPAPAPDPAPAPAPDPAPAPGDIGQPDTPGTTHD